MATAKRDPLSRRARACRHVGFFRTSTSCLPHVGARFRNRQRTSNVSYSRPRVRARQTINRIHSPTLDTMRYHTWYSWLKFPFFSLSLSLSFFLSFSLFSLRVAREEQVTAVSVAVSLCSKTGTPRDETTRHAALSSAHRIIPSSKNTVPSHVYEIYTNRVVAWCVIVSMRGDKVPITRFLYTETHRVRPGRLAARLRVNVLLVISGQLLRRTVPLPHLFLSLFVFRLFLILCPSTSHSSTLTGSRSLRTTLTAVEHCRTPVERFAAPLCVPTLFFPLATLSLNFDHSRSNISLDVFFFSCISKNLAIVVDKNGS